MEILNQGVLLETEASAVDLHQAKFTVLLVLVLRYPCKILVCLHEKNMELYASLVRWLVQINTYLTRHTSLSDCFIS